MTRGHPISCFKPPTRRGRPTTIMAEPICIVATGRGMMAGPAKSVTTGRSTIVARTANAEKESFFFNAEYPMIRWLEANGYDVSYASGIDTDRRGSAALATHKVFLSVGHDEYWSGRTACQRGSRARGRCPSRRFSVGMMSIGKRVGKTALMAASTPYRTLVCYKETHYNAKIDPSPEWTGTWRDPRFSPPADGGRPENALTGSLFMVDAFRNDPLTISSSEGKARFWRNTSIATLPEGQYRHIASRRVGLRVERGGGQRFQSAGTVPPLHHDDQCGLSACRIMDRLSGRELPPTVSHSTATAAERWCSEPARSSGRGGWIRLTILRDRPPTRACSRRR